MANKTELIAYLSDFGEAAVIPPGAVPGNVVAFGETGVLADTGKKLEDFREYDDLSYDVTLPDETVWRMSNEGVSDTATLSLVGQTETSSSWTGVSDARGDAVTLVLARTGTSGTYAELTWGDASATLTHASSDPTELTFSGDITGGGTRQTVPSHEVHDEIALKSYIDARFDYQNIAFTSASVSPSRNEYGSGAVTSVTISYALNRAPTANTTITGTSSKTLDKSQSGSTVITGISLTSGGSWTLHATHSDETGSSTATRSVSITWFHRLYSGVGTASATIDAAFIAGLANKDEKSTVATSFTVNAGAGQYIYFACPSGLTPHFYFGGSQEIEFTRVTGNTPVTGVSGGSADVSFHVYRSGQANLGSTTIEVKAS